VLGGERASWPDVGQEGTGRRHMPRVTRFARCASRAVPPTANSTSCRRTRPFSSYRARGASRCSTVATDRTAGCGTSRSRSQCATRCARLTQASRRRTRDANAADRRRRAARRLVAL